MSKNGWEMVLFWVVSATLWLCTQASNGLRYDESTVLFSPSGSLMQVEYATKAVERGRLAMGIKCSDGVLLCAMKESSRRDLLLSDVHVPRKFFTVDRHIHCTGSGLVYDAVSLVDRCRSLAAQHTRVFGSGIPLQRLAALIGSHKQEMTQRFGRRPMGAALMLAGFDEQNGFGLYTTNPAGMYQAWRATAIGDGSDVIRSQLQKDYPTTTSLADAWPVMRKIIREHLKQHIRTNEHVSQALEMASLTRADGPIEPVSWYVYTPEEIDEAFEHRQRLTA